MKCCSVLFLAATAALCLAPGRAMDITTNNVRLLVRTTFKLYQDLLDKDDANTKAAVTGATYAFPMVEGVAPSVQHLCRINPTPKPPQPWITHVVSCGILPTWPAPHPTGEEVGGMFRFAGDFVATPSVKDLHNASPALHLDAQVLTHYDSSNHHPYMYEFKYYYHQTLVEALLKRVKLLMLLRKMNLE